MFFVSLIYELRFSIKQTNIFFCQKQALEEFNVLKIDW